MHQIGTPVMRGVVFGDIGVNSQIESPDPCGGSVPTAGALVLTFLLNNFQDPEYQELAERWEKEVGNDGERDSASRAAVVIVKDFVEAVFHSLSFEMAARGRTVSLSIKSVEREGQHRALAQQGSRAAAQPYGESRRGFAFPCRPSWLLLQQSPSHALREQRAIKWTYRLVYDRPLYFDLFFGHGLLWHVIYRQVNAHQQ